MMLSRDRGKVEFCAVAGSAAHQFVLRCARDMHF
jgi:hypothetical protein